MYPEYFILLAAAYLVACLFTDKEARD